MVPVNSHEQTTNASPRHSQLSGGRCTLNAPRKKLMAARIRNNRLTLISVSLGEFLSDDTPDFLIAPGHGFADRGFHNLFKAHFPPFRGLFPGPLGLRGWYGPRLELQQ